MGLCRKPPPPPKKKTSLGGIMFVVIAGVIAVKDPSMLSKVSSAASGMSDSLPHASGTVAQEQAYAQQIFGNDSSQQYCLIRLWNQESGWDAYAVNSSSGAYGIPQALPSAHGHPFNLGDWRAQIQWGKDYINSTYGSPCGAWAHEQSHNWY